MVKSRFRPGLAPPPPVLGGGGADYYYQDGGTPALESPEERVLDSTRFARWPRPIGLGAAGWALLERKPISDDKRGQSQQEELRGDGGEKGEALGFFTFTKK